MSEPLTDSSSAQASQEDILHFEDEEDNDIADDIVDENEEEVSHSHSPSPAEEIQEPKQFIFPQNSGYFRIYADKVNEKKTSLASAYGSKSKLTIIFFIVSSNIKPLRRVFLSIPFLDCELLTK